MMTTTLLVLSTIAGADAELSCTTKQPVELELAQAVACQGKKGFFVPSDLFRKISAAAEARGSSEAALQLARREIEELRATIGSMEKSLHLSREVVDLKDKALDASLKTVDELLEDVGKASSRSWYEHPVIWMVAGGILAGGIAVAAFWAVGEIGSGWGD